MPNLWEKYAVPRFIKFACSMPAVMKDRSKIVPKASGKVLELGCGGGINLQFYDPSKIESLTGLDPSAELLDYTRSEAKSRGIDMDILDGIGEAMPFADASFDTVLTTFTLCSVQDGEQVLSEMRRVLKPGGKILFLEHGRAPDKGPEKWQQRIEPAWKHIAGGCHLQRPVSKLFESNGFALTGNSGHYAPKTPRWLGWMEMGEARPL
ncbi:class I SAM-dependent methyltransferase [Parasphingorhabdus halotolerans]|uniref:Class I SAM-dependent methyltransferase n=1 Tax=Parasphingorhabdus halotolerans TaxID=2725558 RepID=A0A6H2DN25_9SPHN|nr:class I SAM-dependent methyltransferase [Parasphingorhabdus halotolerans]QJB70069.1 class I SAM-dependent methyltransferase [Parasphingorhabdus halotolerans]